MQIENNVWICVGDALPQKADADENGKVLVFMVKNQSQKSSEKSIYDFSMVKYLEKNSFWQRLPKNP